MIRRILVPFDGSPSSRSALSIACNISGIIGAELVGLYVEDESRFVDVSLAAAIAENVTANPIINHPLPPEQMLEVEEEVAGERAVLRQLFRELCADDEVEAEFLSARGAPAEVIAEKARAADYIIMGSSGLHRGRDHAPDGATVEALLRATTRPVLVLPDEPVGQARAVIAYDGSRASERALAAGAEICSICEIRDVHVLSVGFSAEETKRIQAPALEYLAAYGLTPVAASASGKAGDAIGRYADEVDTSVLVLGAFGSNRLSEMLFGSTTHDVLRYGGAATLLVG
ncbi:MAG: universal stress protein [Bdellovibrionales bacterium]|nr:universal stress protein [Bdellovibrionales bacterium]